MYLGQRTRQRVSLSEIDLTPSDSAHPFAMRTYDNKQI